jgi:hypothetical protein
MMPLLFAFMAMSFASGLSLYWFVNSLFRIVLQYRMTGWGGLRRQKPADAEAGKKYIKFEPTESKKMTIKDKDDQIIITDKDSLKKSQKSGFLNRFKFTKGNDQDNQDQEK